MSGRKSLKHVVVDGSNIATEGRSMPSLSQLNDAVLAFMDENPSTLVTVVVDATFGHRIDKKEADEFEQGIANNELVAPPAGAVGRGDAFVLGIADKAKAAVLSNDSFQEFHGEYEWLFDEGRLIGGKPVPHVGWVFVDRVPVRGPVSRKATRSTKTTRSTTSGRRRRGASSGAELGPPPVPSSPPPRPAATRRSEGGAPESSADADAAREPRTDAASDVAPRPVPRGNEPVNDLMPFLEFVQHHPVGTSVNAIVDAYSSHGAYVTISDADVRAYLPLRLMSDPPPRSARAQLKLGEAVTLVVVAFAPARRSIDCALPDMAPGALAEHGEVATEEVTEAVVADAEGTGRRRRGRRRTTADDDSAQRDASAEIEGEAPSGVDDAAPARRPARRRRSTQGRSASRTVEPAAAPAVEDAESEPVAKKATGRRRTSRKTAAVATADDSAAQSPTTETAAATGAKKTATRTVAAKKTATRTTAAKQTAAKKTATRTTAAKKSAAKKTAAKKTAAKKSAAKKTAAKQAATKTTATKTTATKTAATKTAATKTAATKTATKRAAAKTTATKSAAKKTTMRRRSAKKTASGTTPAGT